jgi:hypothetical protein
VVLSRVACVHRGARRFLPDGSEARDVTRRHAVPPSGRNSFSVRVE